MNERVRRQSVAVTAFFRAFGGRVSVADGETRLGGGRLGSHGVECVVLAGLTLVMVMAAWWDVCRGWMGEWWACVAACVLGLLTLHGLPFLFRKRGAWEQWVWWEMGMTLWVLWKMFGAEQGRDFWVLRLWWLWLAMQLIGALVLGWRRMMEVAGWKGIWMRMGLVVGLHLLWAIGGWWGGWAWWVGGAVGLGGVFCWGTLNPASEWWGPIYRRVEGDDWLLTVDDGPDPEQTPRVLDLLDRVGRKAVFFMIGEKVAAHPELAREVVRRGHELGNHTMTHPQGRMWCLGPWRTWKEIEGGQQAIEAATGVRPRWFRAPVGHRNFFTHPVLGALGLKLAGWTRRGFDTRGEPVEVVLARILRKGLAAGDIVLVHEGTPMALELLAGLVGERSGAAAIEDDQVVVERGVAPEGADADRAEG